MRFNLFAEDRERRRLEVGNFPASTKLNFCGPSLIAVTLPDTFLAMSMSRTAQKLLAVIAAVVFLAAGAAQAAASVQVSRCECPAQSSMSMADMAGMHKDMQCQSGQSTPCKNMNDCVGQTCCASLITAMLVINSTVFDYWSTVEIQSLFSSNDSVSTQPALPPPILVV